eukprot:CAMPEP_0178510742 /NCGR_PEP_ID=MMETSP0696-20121128/21996_1 /TAXON_ID=265572 /ORGANISM="Extubocellulus spinifer, Strain CCMP396" /LENGTH=153 /DNA_ID=CAMNT_0020140479 /DNA_START=80 /DNA_END=539 /DNA_ORIENTATION=+
MVPSGGVPAPTAPPNTTQFAVQQRQESNNPPIVDRVALGITPSYFVIDNWIGLDGVALGITPFVATASGAAAAPPPASGTASAASAAGAPAPALTDSEVQVGDRVHLRDHHSRTIVDVTVIGIEDGGNMLRLRADDNTEGRAARADVMTHDEW